MGVKDGLKIELFTFLHCGGDLPDPGSCFPAGRLQLRSGTDPPCQPDDSAAPSAAVTDRETAGQNYPDNTGVKGQHGQHFL